jgi:hypothetical protein
MINTKFSLAKYIVTVVSMSIQKSLYILEDVSLSTIYLYFILQEVKERGKHQLRPMGIIDSRYNNHFSRRKFNVVKRKFVILEILVLLVLTDNGLCYLCAICSRDLFLFVTCKTITQFIFLFTVFNFVALTRKVETYSN